MHIIALDVFIFFERNDSMYDDSKGISIKRIVTAVAVAIAATLVMFVVFALIIYFTNVSEGVISKAVFAISIAALILGGIVAAKGADNSGFLYGLITGTVYFVIVIISSIIKNGGFEFSMNSVILLLGYLSAGMLGGSIGINMSNGKKYKKRYL